MYKMHIVEEAMEAVDTLNEEYYNQTADEERTPFSFIYAGWWMCIKYLDECIWANDSDERDYVGNGEYEPLLDCLKRRVRNIHCVLSKFGEMEG